MLTVLSKLTGLCFLTFAPDMGPRFEADEDGWFAAASPCGWNEEEGPPKDCEGNDGIPFCFLREADTEGLGIASWSAWPVI